MLSYQEDEKLLQEAQNLQDIEQLIDNNLNELTLLKQWDLVIYNHVEKVSLELNRLDKQSSIVS